MRSKEEIMEGLRHCSVNYTCRNCPYYSVAGCVRKLTKDALALIENKYCGKTVVPKTWKETIMKSFMKGE